MNPYSKYPCDICGEPSNGSISVGADSRHNFIYKYYCAYHWKRIIDKRKKKELAQQRLF